MPSSEPEREILIAGRPVPVTVRINRRARRLIIRVDALRPGVVLTCPSRRTVREGLAFVEKRRGWIARCLAEGPAAQPFVDGALIPVRGAPCRIAHVAGRHAARLEAGILSVGGEARFLSRRVEDFLRAEARRDYTALADGFCTALGVSRRRITLRDTRSRWGSCSSAGSISLSWRLILAPPHVCAYVVAHEVAHLRHMDHSPAFWAVVDELIEDRKTAQDWLKRHGAGLHGYGAALRDASLQDDGGSVSESPALNPAA